MTEKTVEQKIKESKELIIQNVEKTIQHKMVYMFLRDRKKEAEVKQYSVNSKDGIIKIEFHDHDKAEAFYNEANFNDRILIRPFNIYFNLTLTENEMKKYYLEGITEENQRKLFQFARKIGVCKLYTSYGSGARAKLKNTGLLSFIRKDAIPQADFNNLTEQLSSIGIKIFNYVQEKGMKVSLNLINYLSDDLYNNDEVLLHELAEKAAKDIIGKYIENPKIQHISVLVKKKEVPENKKEPLDNKTSQNKINKVLSSALFEFQNAQTTYANYEKVRIGIKDEGQSKVRLFFHNEQNNSFLSLITQGLSKPEGQSEKQVEENLIKSFREINPNVLQVNIYPMSYNSTYIGRVYLKSEEEGKNFLVDYSSFRSKIYIFYKENSSPPIFNINVDSKTLRKIKLAEKKAKDTEEKIKKQSQANRRDHRRAGNQYPLPINPMVVNPMMQPLVGPNLMMGPPGVGGMPGILPHMKDNMMGMPPFSKPMTGPLQQPQSLKNRIQSIVRDKLKIMDMEENSAKRILAEPLKNFIEEQGLAPGGQSARIVNGIIKDAKVENVLKLFEFPDLLKEAVLNFKNNQN